MKVIPGSFELTEKSSEETVHFLKSFFPVQCDFADIVHLTVTVEERGGSKKPRDFFGVVFCFKEQLSNFLVIQVAPNISPSNRCFFTKGSEMNFH